MCGVHNEKHDGEGDSRETNDFPYFGIVLSLADCLHETTNLVSWYQLILWVSIIIHNYLRNYRVITVITYYQMEDDFLVLQLGNNAGVMSFIKK